MANSVINCLLFAFCWLHLPSFLRTLLLMFPSYPLVPSQFHNVHFSLVKSLFGRVQRSFVLCSPSVFCPSLFLSYEELLTKIKLSITRYLEAIMVFKRCWCYFPVLLLGFLSLNNVELYLLQKDCMHDLILTLVAHYYVGFVWIGFWIPLFSFPFSLFQSPYPFFVTFPHCRRHCF